MASLKYWIWLSSAVGVGPVTARKLLDGFGTPERVYYARRSDYEQLIRLRAPELRGLENKDLAPSERALATCEEKGYRVMTIQDAGYPDRLRNIYDPPIILYIRGRLPDIDGEAVVAIVGTRRCTRYGLREAERIGREVTGCGLLVTTGLALGVDSAAARGALGAGGRVVGVIGSGLDVVYPSENVALFDAVASSGAIISEYPPGSAAVSGHFPARNRIISGLSVGVAVIEAPERSGALITAADALEQGREVFAMPGNVDAPSCSGSNALLREGAIPLISADDIAAEYSARFPDKITLPDWRQSAPARMKGRADTAPSPPVRLAGAEAAETRGGEEPAAESAENGDSAKKEVDNGTQVEYIDLSAPDVSLTPDERRVAEAVAPGGVHIDAVIAGCSLAASDALAALTMLEIKGIITQARGKFFSLAVKAAKE
ncbi:MAG: DNA-processing protein DprA [Oscillospiraceae bacterium]|jgi:DNA processing protein|nr:DNA-processing protein DprA [Oscillospiraceae bacterium]